MRGTIGRTGELLAEVGRLNPLHVDFMRKSTSGLTPDELERLDTYLSYCLDSGLTLEYVALSYDTVVRDHFREQVYFKRHGHYRYSTYAEAASNVYHNRDYMDRYMHGLAITEFLWPNHRAMFRFFVQTLPKDKSGRYLEVGPGHGLHMITAVRLGSFSECVGVDVSETSIALTRAILEHPLYGPFENYRLEQRDFLGSDLDGTFDAIAMGEVLEHVEDAGSFLAKARELLAPGGYFYMSTAVNAGVIDHICLFRSVAEVDELVTASGFAIDDRIAIPHIGTTVEQCERERLPVSVSYALS
jgi:2-polyprenyl-3-methyl-5-hydroxy-6-metoxy-1,4-benzoquinol methylase